MVQDTATDAPTLDEIPQEVVSEVQQVLSELDAASRGAKEGEALGEVDVQGMKVRRRKTSSMVHMGGRALPERVKVFDRRGEPSLVPTVQLGYHLSKTDNAGNRVFFSRPPAGVEPPKPIDKTCPICLERGVRKKFYSRYAHRQHMVILHPLEFEMIREEEKEAAAREGLVDQLRRMTPEEKQELAALFAVEKVAETPVVVPTKKADYPCRKCGKSYETPQGRSLHERKWCKEKS